jgi:tryptophan synthase alpha chain
MTRIGTTFSKLRTQGKKALIPFITAGDPEPTMTVPLMQTLVKCGADVIELGVPFSDPMADGPAIQQSSERALKHHVGLKDVLGFVAQFRNTDQSTPVVLMGYANPIEHMGYQRFAQAAHESGVDGVLVVDYPPDEGDDLVRALAERDIDQIFLLAPTSSEARIATVAKVARGYIYYVSLKGVTGAAHIDLTEVAAKLPVIRAIAKLPVGVGFGIRDAATARAVARIADAVVVGSRLVQEIAASTPESVQDNVGRLMKELREAIDAV